jgi:hypothetical protein
MPLVSPSEMACTCDNRLLAIALAGEQDGQEIRFFFLSKGYLASR